MDSLDKLPAPAPVNCEGAPSWTVSTNWTIVGGSITDTVTLESFFCPLTDSKNCDAKTPLILCTTSSESSPPEITVKFSKKHEIRQVYLRSTARVYEVYYTEKNGACNEYLSTVRCGTATRDGTVLQAFTVGETSSPHQSNPRKQLNEDEQMKNSQNEESWVEVIVTENSLSSKSSSLFLDDCDEPICKTPQDFHEAAAEIEDMNPCFSVTFKLLSLVNKACVCIDELYVFADPVCEESFEESDETNTKNSLMAMMIPAIMQLSSSGRENPVTEERKMNESTVVISPKECSSPPPSKVTETKSNESEALLLDLISRISRVEETLLRFETSVLNPIKSIDERLIRVENQLESLAKKPASRIYAPEFSCDESEDNTSRDCEVAEVHIGRIDCADEASEESAKPKSGCIGEESAEFNNADIGEESVEKVIEQRRHVSIDDALASALSGLMMSSSQVPDDSVDEESESEDSVRIIDGDKQEHQIEVPKEGATLSAAEFIVDEKEEDDTQNDVQESDEIKSDTGTSILEVTFFPTSNAISKSLIDELFNESGEIEEEEERCCTTREEGNQTGNWIMEESLI